MAFYEPLSMMLLEEIPAGVFVSCDNITLDLSYNNIRNIHQGGPNAFYPFNFGAGNEGGRGA
jgi:hypothetical protein